MRNWDFCNLYWIHQIASYKLKHTNLFLKWKLPGNLVLIFLYDGTNLIPKHILLIALFWTFLSLLDINHCELDRNRLFLIYFIRYRQVKSCQKYEKLEINGYFELLDFLVSSVSAQKVADKWIFFWNLPPFFYFRSLPGFHFLLTSTFLPCPYPSPSGTSGLYFPSFALSWQWTLKWPWDSASSSNPGPCCCC